MAFLLLFRWNIKKLAFLLIPFIICLNSPDMFAQSSKVASTPDKNISFYPNPFQAALTLEVKNLPVDNKTVKVEVYNIIGKLFYKNEFKFQNTEAKFNIDLDHLQPGVYFMYIINSDKKVFKILKEGNQTSSGNTVSPNRNWAKLHEKPDSSYL